MNNCKKHNRFNCYEYECQQDNAGKISLDASGGLAIGLGNGLAIDTTNGDLGFQVGGVTFDF